MVSSVSISGVCERDIDLLLLEEFIASFEFLQWFIDQVTKSAVEVKRLLDAQRSVTQSNGESDLEVLLQNANGHQVCVLIENKINAGLQPQQAERYQQRGENYLAQEKCANFYTVIVAPERYFGSDTNLKGFAAKVTYEQIRAWFSNQDMGDRRRYKELLLESAIGKGITGYQPITDPVVTDFWRQYWELAREYAPELKMREPGAKPAGSNFIEFRQTGLPGDIVVVHKLPSGCVDLQFCGMAEQLSELKNRFGNNVDVDMSFTKAKKSGCIRLYVPSINVARDFVQQKNSILQGVNAARRLLKLYLQVTAASD